MTHLHVDELDRIELDDGFEWRPVRRRFGIRAFGVNAYAPGATGRIVEEHTESTLGHEEIYLVLRGRARFTVDGNEHELGPGELVFVRLPSLRRGAVALDRRRGRARARRQARRAARAVCLGGDVRRGARGARGPLGRRDPACTRKLSSSSRAARRSSTTSPAWSRAAGGRSTRSCT